MDHFRLLIDLARAIAPELRLYLIDAASDYAKPADALAWTRTGQVIDFALRAMLQDRGEWRGPGCIITMDATSSDSLRELDQLFLHEIAHALPAVELPEEIEPPAELVAWQIQHARSVAAAPEVANKLPPWTSDDVHGSKFVRRCLHLHHRANAVKYIIGLDYVAGGNYGMSGPLEYKFALGHEPARMLDATFSEIEAVDPPGAFLELWERDVRHWERFNGRDST